MDSKRLKSVCQKRNNCKDCYWGPTSNIRAAIGKNVNILMLCKTCNAREDIFLTEKEYKLHENIILKEVKNEI
jgi:hypothetical protein|tara:strand:+ start:39410 stop:39628 length:219 start_codon:yes stop_codon:yes gene_type:complete